MNSNKKPGSLKEVKKLTGLVERRPEKAALYAVAINAFSTILKFVMASLTGSLAVMAEAFHSLSDIITSILVFLAVRGDRLAVGRKKAGSDSLAPRVDSGCSDSAHSEVESAEAHSPDGKAGRVVKSPSFQLAISLLIGLILLFVSINILNQAYLGTRQVIESSLTAAFFLLFAAAGSYFLSRFEIAVGESTNSLALIADGHHSNVDMLGALLVSFSLFSNSMGLNVDIYVAAVIGGIILLQSVEILGNVIWFALNRRGTDVEFSYVKREQIVAGLLSGEWSLVKLSDFIEKKTGFKLEQNRLYRFVRSYGSAVIILACICLYLSTSLVVVGVAEEGLLFRCGKLLQTKEYGLNDRGTLSPGLCIKYPWPFDRVVKASVNKAKVISVGFKGEGKGDKIIWTERHHEIEYEMLTGDSQFITIFLSVEYHISDLLKYHLSAKGSELMLEGIANGEVIKMLSELEFFEMAIHDREGREKVFRERLQKTVDALDLGLKVDLVAFKDIHPPVSVAPEFEAVISAEEEKESIVNQAEAIKNRIIPLARAEAVRKIAESEAYGVAVEGKAIGQSERFLLQRPVDSLQNEVVRRQLFFELQQSVLKKPVKVLVGDGCESPSIIMVPSGSSSVALSQDYNDYEK
jgi:regulator of protease activity HflC (stomatin/prohibitin superfamily)